MRAALLAIFILLGVATTTLGSSTGLRAAKRARPDDDGRDSNESGSATPHKAHKVAPSAAFGQGSILEEPETTTASPPVKRDFFLLIEAHGCTDPTDWTHGTHITLPGTLGSPPSGLQIMYAAEPGECSDMDAGACSCRVLSSASYLVPPAPRSSRNRLLCAQLLGANPPTAVQPFSMTPSHVTLDHCVRDHNLGTIEAEFHQGMRIVSDMFFSSEDQFGLATGSISNTYRLWGPNSYEEVLIRRNTRLSEILGQVQDRINYQEGETTLTVYVSACRKDCW